MSTRPVIVTENAHLALLPEGESLSINDAVSDNDAVTLRQLNMSLQTALTGAQLSALIEQKIQQYVSTH